MKINRYGTMVNYFLYGGSKDERTRSLYDRIGYYIAIFLFISILFDISIKTMFFKFTVEQILSELIILIFTVIITIFLYIKNGITIFESKGQKNRFNLLLAIFSIFIVTLYGYLALWLKLPGVQLLLKLGPIAWISPLIFAIVSVPILLSLVKLVSFLSNLKDLKMKD